MTATDKARELIEKFAPIMPNEDWHVKAKQCALTAVDEIISIGWNLPHYENKTGLDYWNSVKTEINKL